MPIKFEAKDKLLGDILTGREKYKIPRYQRPYSWTTDNISDLWNDLQEESAFLGSFVFNCEKENTGEFVEVIDGQQRLITLTILMAVLRDTYKELGNDDKFRLTQETIAHKDPITGKETYRLKCGDSLNDFFCENIQRQNSHIISSTPREKEKRAVKDNYKFFKDEIIAELNLKDNISQKIEYLDNLKRKVFDYKIIEIKTGNDEDAYSIFETVNARGADLTIADLLKNFLFSRLLPTTENDVDFAKKTWSTIENNIENAGARLTISKFIRYFWLSKYTFVPEKKLYKEVKRLIKEPNTFLSDISKASDYYYKIANKSINPTAWLEEFKDEKTGRRIHESLIGLRTMGITQCYALLFCLLINKDRIGFDFSDTFKVIEKYHFAYSAICKLPGNIVERTYFNTAQEIQQALKIDNVKKRTKVIQSILTKFKNKLDYPKKEFFIEKFMDVEYTDHSLVIYILSTIEKQMGFREIRYEFDRTNIEHILPREPKEWGLFKKDIQNYVDKLGNLTLIAEKINGSMGNKPLREKIKLFKNSKLSTNKKLVKTFKLLKYKWGEKEINERQRELAEFAYDTVWKFKEN